jgi:hypothetical protein
MLSSYEFLGKGNSTEIILHAATAPRRALSPAGTASDGTHGTTASDYVSDSTRAGNTEPLNGVQLIVQQLVQRGIAERQAQRLVEGQEIEALRRIEAIISHFDKLVASASHLVSKSPAGFLYRAVERPLEFQLPEDREGRSVTSKGRSSKNTQQHNFAFNAAPSPRPTPVKVSLAEREGAYLSERARAVQEFRRTVDPSVLAALEGEVESGFAKLRAHISQQRFAEAVQRGVDQKLLDMNSFPTLEEWSRSHKQGQ